MDTKIEYQEMRVWLSERELIRFEVLRLVGYSIRAAIVKLVNERRAK